MRDKSERYFPIIEKFLNSNLSAQVFSEQNGLKKTTLDYWKKRYREKNKPGGQGFAAVSIVGGSGKTISIYYTDGTRLVLEGGASAAMLKEILPAFAK